MGASLEEDKKTGGIFAYNKIRGKEEGREV
jgi:hypothetical protein